MLLPIQPYIITAVPLHVTISMEPLQPRRCGSALWHVNKKEIEALALLKENSFYLLLCMLVCAFLLRLLFFLHIKILVVLVVELVLQERQFL